MIEALFPVKFFPSGNRDKSDWRDTHFTSVELRKRVVARRAETFAVNAPRDFTWIFGRVEETLTLEEK